MFPQDHIAAHRHPRALCLGPVLGRPVNLRALGEQGLHGIYLYIPEHSTVDVQTGANEHTHARTQSHT